MKRALLSASVVLLCGCSIIFDPGKVPQCSEGEAPEAFGALAGDAPGRLIWQWNAKSAGGYRLCTSVTGGSETCELVQCDAGACAQTQDGLLNDVRMNGTVSAVSTCDGGIVGTQTTAASAIDTTQSATGWVLESTNCGRADALAIGGLISIEQTNAPGNTCLAAFVTGDEGWGDLTLDAEVHHSPSLPGLVAGIGIAQNATGHRIGFVSQEEGFLVYFPSNISKRSRTAVDSFVAEGVDLSSTNWQQVRIIRKGKTVSWSQVPLGQPLVERLRWFDTEAQTGRFGIGAAGAGRFEMRALRVSSYAVPFPDSDDHVAYFPGEDGGMTRARRSGFAPNTGPCPALAACAATDCAPPTGASCLQITTGFGSTQLGYQGPRGLDPNRDWEVSVRFGLPMNAGVGNNTVLSIRGLPILESNRMQTTFGGTNAAPALTDGSWHYATVLFPADGGVLTGTLDGMPVTSTLRWPGADSNRGIDSVRIGGGSAVPLVFHELSVRQP